jgi:predicted Zn-dependent peptidase
MNIALDEFKTLIFENSVYSHSNNILEKTLPQITKEDVINYYNKIFDSKNVIISINGNVNKDTIINSFGEILQDKKQPKFNYDNYKITNLTKHKVTTKTINDLQTAWLFMGWQTSGVNDKNDYVTLKIINTILGGGISSRIYKNLREQEGLAYQLGSSYSPKMLGGSFLVYIGSNPNTIEYSKNKLLKEIERLKMEFVSDTELEYAKNRLKGGLILEMETNSKKASNIGLFETSGFGYDFLKEYVDMIEKVSASDIIRVANKYFNGVYIESSVKK